MTELQTGKDISLRYDPYNAETWTHKFAPLVSKVLMLPWHIGRSEYTCVEGVIVRIAGMTWSGHITITDQLRDIKEEDMKVLNMYREKYFEGRLIQLDVKAFPYGAIVTRNVLGVMRIKP